MVKLDFEFDPIWLYNQVDEEKYNELEEKYEGQEFSYEIEDKDAIDTIIWELSKACDCSQNTLNITEFLGYLEIRNSEVFNFDRLIEDEISILKKVFESEAMRWYSKEILKKEGL